MVFFYLLSPVYGLWSIGELHFFLLVIPLTLNQKSCFPEEKMKSRSTLFASLVIVAMLLLAACGAAAPAATEAPPVYEAPATEAPAFRLEGDAVAEPGAPMEKLPEGAAQELLPLPTSAAFEIANQSGDLTVIERSNRMIVKNADIRLMVKDTDSAIDRATQIVGDAGGYIVSSRVWYQDYYGNNLKYAAITIGIPVEEVEKVLG